MPSLTPNIFAILAAVAAVATAGVADDSPAFSSGANGLSDRLFAANPELDATDTGLLRRNDGHMDMDVNAPLVVQVHAHIVESKKGRLKDFNEATVRAQLDVLNNAFKPAKTTFVLNSTDWIVDAEWAKGDDDLNMKIDNHKGDARSLNLFFIENFDETKVNKAAECSFAWQQFDPRIGPMADACIITAYTLPGWSGFDSTQWEGKLIVHEVGHWFNLTHTSTQECKNALSVVLRNAKTTVCPRGITACSDLDNFMSSAPDSCWTKFTPHQIRQMREAWDKFRAPAKPGPPVRLFPIEPIKKEGKLPYYRDANSILAVMTHCQPDRWKQIREKREEYCGTFWFCIFGLYREKSEDDDQPHDDQPHDDQPYDSPIDCLDARAIPYEDGKETAGSNEKEGWAETG